MEEKTCARCKKVKPAEDFPISYRHKGEGRRRDTCKKCVNIFKSRGLPVPKRAPEICPAVGRRCVKCKEVRAQSDFRKRSGYKSNVCVTCYLFEARTRVLRNWSGLSKDEQGRRSRAGQIKHRYGLTIGEYKEMLERQGGVCAICKREPQGTFHIDHCHGTGAVRGLLCGSCNKALGLFKDDPDILLRASDYLRVAAAASAAEPF